MPRCVVRLPDVEDPATIRDFVANDPYGKNNLVTGCVIAAAQPPPSPLHPPRPRIMTSPRLPGTRSESGWWPSVRSQIEMAPAIWPITVQH